jgi:hypothetical protein
VLTVSTADPNFDRILGHQFRLEKLRAVRILLLTLLAVLGVGVWADAVWPRSAHLWGGSFPLLCWPLLFAGFLLVRAVEGETERRLERLVCRRPSGSREQEGDSRGEPA